MKGSKLRYAVGGLQAGVLGVLGMLAVFAAAALLNHRPWWLVPNLLATIFHGPDAYTADFTRSTQTGLAFLFLLYGSLGAVWGILWADRPLKRLWLGGAVTGYLVYLLLDLVIWKNLAPLINLYVPEMQMRLAHLIWGIALGQSPVYAANIRNSGRIPVRESNVRESTLRESTVRESTVREEPPPLPDSI